MSVKPLMTSTAVAALLFAGVAVADPAATVDAAGPLPDETPQQYKQRKVAEATAADERYHANRTEANRVARDRAEAEAAAAIQAVNAPAPEGTAEQ